LKNPLIRILRSIAVSILIITGSSFAQSAAARDRDWQPQRTWVYVVGLLKFENGDVFSSFPQTNRRDAQLVDFYRQQGVPEDHIVFLKDGQATSRRVHNSFPAFLAKAQPGDLLFFYYTGHGYKSDDERTTYFATYDAGEKVDGWATDSIVRDVEKYFRGSQALLTADTCYSGSLSAQAQKLGRRVSYASLTSTSATQLSTENWTFTEMLLEGLRGKSFADINGDGEVTLSELAEDIKVDMAFAENQRSTFVTTGNFPGDMLLAPGARKLDPMISRRVEVHSDGSWYKARVIDVRGRTFEVHFYGYEDSDNEWVKLNQIRYSRESELASNRREEEQREPARVRPEVSRVDQSRRSDGGWSESAGSERIRRPAVSSDSSWESSPSQNTQPPRNRRRPQNSQPSWNN
jgi:hypothetical protein